MLKMPNRPRPCKLDLVNEVYALKSFEPFREFSFNLLREGNLLSSHGRIDVPNDIGYNGFDQKYIEYMLQYPVKFWEYCRILDVLPHSKDLKILDIGGGSSPISFYLAAQGAIVDIIDYELVAGDSSIIDNSNDIADKYGWNLIPRHGSATMLPYDSNLFDHVISVSVLEHVGPLKDQIKVFSEVLRVLKPGGMFALTFDYGKIRGIKGHYPIRNSKIIEKLIDTTSFEIIGNCEFDDVDYNAPDIVQWERKYKHFQFRNLRWYRWYTAFSLFLRKPIAL